MPKFPGLLLQLPFFNNYCFRGVWDRRGWEWVDGSSTPFKVYCLHDLGLPIKYLQSQGTSQWLFALRTLFMAGVNWQELPRYITFFFSLTCFFPEDPRLGGQPHRRQQNNLLSTALIICMAFHNNKRKNLDPTACQYLRHLEREIHFIFASPRAVHFDETSFLPSHSLLFYILNFLA